MSTKGILGEAAGLSIGAVLAGLAAVRRGKAFHPDGVVYDARLAIEGSRANGDLFLVGAVPQPSSPRGDGSTEFERLEVAASTGRLAFDVGVARIAGRFRPVGSLHIGRRLGHELDALRFNPWNTGGGLEPAGWLNGARDRAYKLSQGAWRRARRDGAALQDSADRELERRELTASSAA